MAVSADEVVGPDERGCAQAMIAGVLAHHGVVDPVRVRLGRRSGGPTVIQVNLRVCGAGARIQVPGDSPARAIAAGAARLHRQLRRLTTAWQPWPWPDPERGPLLGPGPARVVRFKEFRLRESTPCQVAAVMDAMDYDAYLYTDAETGEDAVLYRCGPFGTRLARQRSMRPPAGTIGAPSWSGRPSLTVNPHRVPTFPLRQAVRWLSEGALPFLFFTAADSGRGNLLYRRYDGALGLIAPAG